MRNNFKRFLSVALVLMMAFAVMTVSAFATEETNALALYELENNEGLMGSGTEVDPYQIGSVEDLIKFRDSVNAGETEYNAPGVYVALTDDIDMAGIDWSVNIGDD